MSKPFMLGQRVLYTLSVPDVEQIRARRKNVGGLGAANEVQQGQQFPADVVAVFDSASLVANLQVHLDGFDAFWATSRRHGDGPGYCQPTAF